MSLITISPFTLPTDNLPDGDYVLRLWYNQSFLDSSGQLVASGSSTSGTQLRFGATVAGGFLSFDALEIYSTLDANSPYPQGINITCQVFKNNAALPIYPFNQSACPPSWIVPNDLGLSITFETWTIANQRIVLANPPQTFYTAPQVDALIEAASYAPATTTSLGLVEISTNPANPLIPIALGANDPRLAPASITQMGFIRTFVAPVDATTPYAVIPNDYYHVPRLATNSDIAGLIGDAVKIEDAAINVSTSTTTLTSASSTFTSALVGKTIVVAGAGSAGGTLTSVISAVPTPHTLTLATPASTTVSSKRAVYGTANSTTTLQSALNTLAASVIASNVPPVLCIPPGNYLFTSGSISIPAGVTIQGSWANSPRFLGYAYSGEPTIMDGTGTSFIITASEGTATGRFILVNSNASLRGCAFFYPMELASLSTPKVYPWTIELTGSCPSLEHCNTYNGYQSVYVHITESPRVYDVQGQPILLGMYTSQVLDSAYFREVHFVPQYTYNETGSITALQTWMSANGTAFKIGRVDDASFEDCFSFGYYKGFYFVNDAPETTPYLDGNGAPGGSAWCHFHGGGADQTNYPVDIAQCQGVLSGGVTTVNGVTFDHSVFTAAQVVPIGGISPICVLVEATLTGHVLLNGCGFVGGQGVFTQALAAGKVDINACYFQVSGGAYKVRAEGATAIEMTGNRFISNTVGSIQGIGARIFQAGNVFADTGTLYAVTFQNSWVNEGSYPNVTYEIRDGRVYLHGAAKNGTMGAVAFTLPTGFLIAATALFPAYSSPSIGGIQIATDGTVLIGAASGSNAIVGFDGISFEVP